ncbi:MAG: flagellar hook-associated protein FlgK [Candidatus Latescibacteria bacterium]|nr:flagellar hook-associated protein FlgK [Candidatus Latescibacterota bacterium]
MANILATLEIGKRALLAQQNAIGTTGHNIANVNTKGYTRQDPSIQAATFFDIGVGQVGSGADFVGVIRKRDRFLDALFRDENQTLGRLEQEEQIFRTIEDALNEPSDSGLARVLNDFWTSWHDLSNDPENTSAHAAVQQRGITLTEALNRLHRIISRLRQDLNGDIEVIVKNVNDMSDQVADLNRQIMGLEAIDRNASDLRDRRDAILDELSTLAPISATEGTDGAVTVSFGGGTLVERTIANHLETVGRSSLATAALDIRFQRTRELAAIDGGQLGGIFNLRDQRLPDYLAQLDRLALTLKDQVNFIHRGGFGRTGSLGVDFFDDRTTGAVDIKLSPAALTDPNTIAAADVKAPGGNRISLNIARLNQALVLDDETTSINGFYSKLASAIGAASSDTQTVRSNQELLVNGLDRDRQTISGVSLDEEAAKLIQFEHAFTAAARLMSTVDDMIQTLLTTL